MTNPRIQDNDFLFVRAALQHKRWDVVLFFLSQYPKDTFDGTIVRNCLLEACKAGALALVTYLVEKKRYRNHFLFLEREEYDDYLTAAVCCNKMNIVRFFVETKRVTRLQISKARKEALRYSRVDMLVYLCSGEDGLAACDVDLLSIPIEQQIRDEIHSFLFRVLTPVLRAQLHRFSGNTYMTSLFEKALDYACQETCLPLARFLLGFEFFQPCWMLVFALIQQDKLDMAQTIAPFCDQIASVERVECELRRATRYVLQKNDKTSLAFLMRYFRAFDFGAVASSLGPPAVWLVEQTARRFHPRFCAWTISLR